MAVIANLRILLFHVVIMISFYTAKSIFPTTLSPMGTLSPHYDDHRLSFLRIRKTTKRHPHLSSVSQHSLISSVVS